jgi:hypothetical protein
MPITHRSASDPGWAAWGSLAWIEAIQQAAKEDFGGDDGTVHPVRKKLPTYLEVLGLPTDKEPEQTAVYKAYKKQALRVSTAPLSFCRIVSSCVPCSKAAAVSFVLRGLCCLCGRSAWS